MTHGGDPSGQGPIGPEPTQVDQRLIAPPDRPTATNWAATYPVNPLSAMRPTPAGTSVQLGTGKPDPGSRKAAAIALIAFIVGLIAVAASQQIGAAEAEKAPVADPTLTPAQQVGPPGMDDPFDLAARLFTKVAHSNLTVSDADRAMIQGQIQQAAQTPADKFRAAVVITEVLDREEEAQKILARLEEDDAKVRAKRTAASEPAKDNPAKSDPASDSVERDAQGVEPTPPVDSPPPATTPATPAPAKSAKPPKPTLAESELDVDIALAKKIWAEGPQSITPEEAARLSDRHGWYAKLLTTHGQTFKEGERAKMVANAQWIVVLMLGAVVVFAIAFFGGIIAASVMGFLVMQGKIKPHFRRPLPGGSVYLETAAVFVVSFLAFKLVVEPLLAAMVSDRSALMGIILALQWALLPIIFWPRLRGVTKAQWKRDVGLSPVEGRSVIREIGAGIFGYFAALPMLALAMAITILIVLGKTLFEGGGPNGEGGAPTPPSNPIAEMISQAPLWQLLMLFALATVWAPIVEECIFRGCLFRHMRSRAGVLLAAFLSAGSFAFMHGYAAMLLLPVFTIGLIFAFIREWRGSIIPTITAHALHNATVLGLVGALFMILRG